jgi:splicing factor U2AF 35 kDa subunit
MLMAIEEFQNFYAEVFLELAKYGEIEDIQVCDNIGEHMFGNLFVKFTSEDDAAKCRNGITGRFYGQKMVVPEFSPVSNFSEGKCRQYEEGTCKRKSVFDSRWWTLQLYAFESSAERAQEGSLQADVPRTP